MTRFAVRSLLARKLRTTLTALAIVLGVAMMSGTYVLTDTIDKAFSSIFDESYAGTDVVVSGKTADIEVWGETPEAPPVPASLVDDIRALPSVELVMGGVYDELNTKIIGEDGKAVDTQGSPSLGFGVDTSPDYAVFNPLNLLEGRWPENGDEVVVDAGVADREGFSIGDRIEISTLQPKRPFTLVGIARYGEVRSLGSATFAIFDVTAAQVLFERDGQFDAISIAARDGVTAEQVIADVRPLLPPTAQATTGVQEAQDAKDEISEFTSFIRYFLLAFAIVALFVGSFVIFNTLSITVAQRTREFATLRTLGASRRQVLGSVLLEALVIGLLASIVGLFAGVGLAKGLEALFRALDLELPLAGTVFATRTIVVSLLVGTLITVVAGLFPAIRATRVPPIAAVREGAQLPALAFLATDHGARARCDRPRARPARLLDVRRRTRDRRAPAVDRGRRATALRGRGDDLVAPGAPARGLRRPPCTGDRWCRRRARAPQRRPQPRPHRGHRGSPHDRRRARRVRGHARERHEGVEPRGDRGADRRGLHRHLAGRLHTVRGCRRRRGRFRFVRPGGHERPLRGRRDRRARGLPDGDRPGAHHPGVLVRLEGGLGRDPRHARHGRRDRRRELRGRSRSSRLGRRS